MKKGTILYGTVCFLLGAAMFAGGAASAAGVSAERSTNAVYIDGQRVELEAYSIFGSNYVKLRDVGKAVGFNVYWDGAVQIDSDAPYTGEAPASAKPTAVQTTGGIVTLPTDGSKYVPQVGDVIRCDDGTLYTIKDTLRWENNVFAPGPLPELPTPTYDWSVFPAVELPKVETRHYATATGDDLFIRNLYETRRMQYTIYEALKSEPTAWRDGKPLAKISLTIPAEDEPYTMYFWPWKQVEITVTAKELRAADGYVLDSTPKSIEIKSGDTQTLTFYNTPTGSLTIIKRDRATGAVLKGAEFQISYASGEFVGNFGGTVTSNGQYTTDANGEIIIKGLQPSTIVIRETRAPEGYILDNSPVTVEVGANDAQTIDIFNDAKQTLTIQKYVTGTTKPIAGVTFLVTDSSGSVIGPNNGEYVTDRNGRIVLTDLTPGTTITSKELKTVEGYVLDTTPQSIEIKGGEAQTMTFFNSPDGGLELIKVNATDKTKRINGVTFEIRRMDGGLVETVTTGDNGRVHVNLDAGDYYAVEIEAAKGFKLDATPHYFTIKDGETTTLTVTNTPFSGILIHKIDADTGKGIYGASFLLYDANHNPIGEYQSDQNGYVYIDDLTESGRYYLRELANEGYVVDTQLKTVNIKSGETIEITWKNTPIRGQIQIIKKSADDNPINGLPKGSLLEGAVFEIYDKAGNVVDTIRSDSRGRAVSRLLPLSRYTIREVSAPKYYGINPTVFNAYLEHEGQIVMFEVEDESVATGVNIKKTGYEEVMPSQPIRYTITGVANTSTVQLGSFYWRDTLPSQVALSKVVTGTYNQQLAYKIVYKTNLSGDQYRTLADNLSTTKNYVLEARPAALGLAANERVTEIMFVFGTVKGGFAEVETAYIYGTVSGGLSNGTSIVNVADVGGLYNGQWIQGVSRWLTTVYTKTSTKLPKTGY